jgi:2-hydroxy-3-oxopropionate reductase
VRHRLHVAPGPPEVESVVTGDDGLLTGFAPGAVHVDLSTNALHTVRHLAGRCAERGVAFVDAPVSGGTFGAERGR